VDMMHESHSNADTAGYHRRTHLEEMLCLFLLILTFELPNHEPVRLGETDCRLIEATVKHFNHDGLC